MYIFGFVHGFVDSPGANKFHQNRSENTSRKRNSEIMLLRYKIGSAETDLPFLRVIKKNACRFLFACVVVGCWISTTFWSNILNILFRYFACVYRSFDHNHGIGVLRVHVGMYGAARKTGKLLAGSRGRPCRERVALT